MIKLTPISIDEIPRKNTKLYALLNDFLDSGAPAARVDGAAEHYCNLACATFTIKRAIHNYRMYNAVEVYRRSGAVYLKRK